MLLSHLPAAPADIGRQGQPRAIQPLRRRHLQVALGMMWLLDGVLQFQTSMFSKSFATGVLAPNATHQPAIVGQPIIWTAQLFSRQPVICNLAFAGIQLVIGAGLIARRTTKTALAASVIWAAGVWWIGEGFGMILTGAASPLTGAPGAALLYALVAIHTWPPPTINHRTPGSISGPVAWCGVWCISACWWLLPANRSSRAVHDLLNGATGGPGWMAGLVHHCTDAADGDGVAIAVTLSALSAATGLGVFSTRPSLFLTAGVALAMTFWVFGQAPGGLHTGQATDPRTGPLLVLRAAVVTNPSRKQRSSRHQRLVDRNPAAWGASPAAA